MDLIYLQVGVVLSGLVAGLGSSMLSHISVGSSSSPSSLASISPPSSKTLGSSLSRDSLRTGIVILTLGEVTGTVVVSAITTTSDDESVAGSRDGVTGLLILHLLFHFLYSIFFLSLP